MHTYNALLISIIFMIIGCCWMTAADVQTTKTRERKYFNYLRLPDGECYNCSTYKCTNNKANLGGSDWCIMLFSDALAHCDSDPTCGGYTMTTAEWFHKQHDKNGDVAVHLTKVGEKHINCSLSQWSSYEKQTATRDTPVVYGRTTCPTSNQATNDQSANSKYVFVSNSNTISDGTPYSCTDHPQNLDQKDPHCILPISDGITLCNLDDQCQGFSINTDVDWQKKFSKNGMQTVQLFSKTATYTPNPKWRSFKKQ